MLLIQLTDGKEYEAVYPLVVLFGEMMKGYRIPLKKGRKSYSAWPSDIQGWKDDEEGIKSAGWKD